MKRMAVVVCVLGLVAGVAGAALYTEDFSQADGPPEGWVTLHPTAQVIGGELSLTPGGAGEPQVFVGHAGEPIYFDSITGIAFDMAYPGNPSAWPFDHGGVLFCCQMIGDRWMNTGYYIDFLPNDLNTAGSFRLISMVNGVHTQIAALVATAYEGRWELELAQDSFVFLVNGMQIFSIPLDGSQLAGGYVGFYAYTNGGQQVTVDNLEIDWEPAQCPTLLPERLIISTADTEAEVRVRIPYGANAEAPYAVTVTSLDPSVVAPSGHDDGSVTITFPAGAAMTQSVPLDVLANGTTQIVITVGGEDCGARPTDVEVWVSALYENDFTLADGPIDDWLVTFGTVEVVDEKLSLRAMGAGEPSAWAGVGGFPIMFEAVKSVQFTIEFPGEPADWVGDHGGIMLNCVRTTNRWQNPGYTIDYFQNRNDPLGPSYRIMRTGDVAPGQPGAQVPLATIRVTECDPDWEITFTPTGFIFNAGNIDPVEVVDGHIADLGGGYLGFWCYSTEGQEMLIDDLRVSFTTDPGLRIAPQEAVNRPVNPPSIFTVTVPFSVLAAGDLDVSVTSTQPGVAVPEGAVGDTLVLSFFQGEALTQTFAAVCLGPGETEFVVTAPGIACPAPRASFTVREEGEPFFGDTFSQPDGPPLNWTPYEGAWEVRAGELTVGCGEGPECWIWAGNPPVRIEGADRFTFDVILEHPGAHAVGRHGGVMFCAGDPTMRWMTSGYELSWIDRVGDLGYRFIRYDHGVGYMVSPPTGTAFGWDPGVRWEIEFDGNAILLMVDGEIIFDAVDGTYREGHFGFWCYSNGSSLYVDNVELGNVPVVGTPFVRGDVNADGATNIADAISLLSHLFAGAASPPCAKAADANDDGLLNIADAITILSHLFASAGDLPPPFGACGLDPTEDTLPCEAFPPCR